LSAVVHLARLAGVDGESALRGWAGRFKDRFQALEAAAAARGRRSSPLSAAAVEILWNEAG